MDQKKYDVNCTQCKFCDIWFWITKLEKVPTLLQAKDFWLQLKSTIDKKYKFNI